MALQNRFRKSKSPEVNPAVNLAGASRLLNIADAAKYIAAHPWYVRTLIRTRQIPYLTVGRGYAIDRVDLDRFIDNQKVGVLL